MKIGAEAVTGTDNLNKLLKSSRSVLLLNFLSDPGGLRRKLERLRCTVLQLKRLNPWTPPLPVSIVFISLNAARPLSQVNRCLSVMMEHSAFADLPFVLVGPRQLLSEVNHGLFFVKPVACLTAPVDSTELEAAFAKCDLLPQRLYGATTSQGQHTQIHSLETPTVETGALNEQFFRSVLEELPLGIMVSETEGNVVFSNSAASHLLGRDVRQRRRWEELADYGAVHNDGTRFRADEYPVNRALLYGERVVDEEVLYRRPCGHESILSISARTLPGRKNKLIVSTFLDVTVEHAAIKELERSKKEIEEFFLQAPAAMVMLRGPEHIYTLANQHYEKFVGRSVLGKKVLEAFNYQEVGDFVKLLDRVYQTGKPYTATELPIDLYESAEAGGPVKRHWINVGYHPVRSAAGEVAGIFAIHEEVTNYVETRLQLERSARKLESEQEKLRAMFTESPVGVAVLTGPTLVFENVNARWTGLADERVYIGRTFQEVYPELKEGWLHQRLLEVYRTGALFQGSEISVVSQMADEAGKHWYYDVSYVRLPGTEDDVHSIFAQASDVTERVLARFELEAAKKMAEKASATKSAFVANMSHEIRTPLGAIIGFIDLLEDPELTSSAAKDYISVINRNSNHLLRIVDDVLDLAKVEAGKVEIEQAEFSLIEFFSEFCSFMNLRALESGVQFDFSSATLVPEFVVSDSTRIRQILTNLVGNAIKFSPQGKVTLGFSYNAGLAHFTVKDNGRGISEEQAAKLFKPFVQADDSTTRKFGGTGLGLALAKNLCRALGGDLQLKYSALETGSCFAADFPLVVTKESAFASVQELSTLGHRLCQATDHRYSCLKDLDLLVVEDSSDNQTLIAKIVNRVGSRVTLASNGLEGVEKGLSHDYDVILMDIQMPIMDGHQAVIRLRANGYSGPIVALTAHAMKDEVEKTTESGFSHFLSKPIVRSKLLDLLSTLHPH